MLGYFADERYLQFALVFAKKPGDQKISGHELASPFILNYYQGENEKCFLFSYTVEDLKQMKLAAGFSLESQKSVFFLTKDGLQVLSRTKYEQMQPTLEPHPYDPALCRPKPKYAIRAKYYLENFPEEKFPKPVIQSIRQSFQETLARCKSRPKNQWCEETENSLRSYCQSKPGSELCRQTDSRQ